LDDFPAYTFGIERVRVWFFRLLLLMAMIGSVILAWQRYWRTMPLWIAIGANVLSAALFNAKERYRMPVDGYLALLAMFFVCWLWARLRARRQLRVGQLLLPGESVMHR
jgi:nicotinamide riboside transporter PnuC